MNGIHYNEWGIRTIAKETKKSLYSTANIGTDRLTIINSLNKETEKSTVAPAQTTAAKPTTETPSTIPEPTENPPVQVTTANPTAETSSTIAEPMPTPTPTENPAKNPQKPTSGTEEFEFLH